MTPRASDRDPARRIRAGLRRAGLAAAVLTHPHDVRYATGFHSILERWGQMEPMAGAIVFADDAKPMVLAIPEASLGILAILEKQGAPCAFEEIRTFDLLNFCEVTRYADPDRAPSRLAEHAIALGAAIRGDCQSDIVAALAAALGEHGSANARVAFDDLRVGAAVGARLPVAASDALDLMIAARMVKSDGELARYREVGQVADRIIAHTATLLHAGADWTDVQARICDFMVRNGVRPVDEGAVLFGGAYDADDFTPELFRTAGGRRLRDGDIVILETQGVLDGFWIDINRTALFGAPSPEYQRLHDILRDAFLTMVDRLRPGVQTNSLPAIGLEHLRRAGVAAPEKLLVVAHGVGLMPLELPLAFPASGLAGVKQGFRLEEGMLVSLDCLFFGAKLGPCHMENVYAITAGAPEPMYQTPLELIVAPGAPRPQRLREAA
jgi:Xaa-Pro aminopeptidase